MNHKQLEHLLRASAEIVGDYKLVVIGSQSLLGKYPDAPEDLLFSVEADIFAKNKRKDTDKFEEVSEGSRFHETHGYYADPVSEKTAILPKEWKARLINVTTYSDRLGKEIVGLCLDPHDLFVSKVAAGREKDIEFVTSMIEHNMVSMERVIELAKTVSNTLEDLERSKRIVARIEGIFARVEPEKNSHINENSGRYTGEIISKTDYVVQQDVGKDQIKIHQADKLSLQPEIGRTYTIQYKNGLGVVTEKTQVKERSR